MRDDWPRAGGLVPDRAREVEGFLERIANEAALGATVATLHGIASIASRELATSGLVGLSCSHAAEIGTRSPRCAEAGGRS